METDLSIINDIADYLRGNYLSYPKIVDISEVDLTKFQKQECSCEPFDFEYVKQGGGGMTGDEFGGTILFPLKDNKFISIDYEC